MLFQTLFQSSNVPDGRFKDQVLMQVELAQAVQRILGLVQVISFNRSALLLKS